MSKKKIDKDDLKAPDAFVSTSDRVFAFIEAHAKTILGAVLTVAVLGIGYVAYGYIRGSQETKASEALFGPEAELRRAEERIREERGNQIKDLMKKDGKAKAEGNRPVDFKADYQPLVDKIATQIRSHSATKTAAISAMNLSYFLIQQKQAAAALEVLEAVKYKPSKGDLVNGFWQMHRGLVWLENGQFDKAIEAYQEVSKTKDLSYFHPEALLKLGFAYELKGDAAKARENYEKLGREFPRTEAATTAQQYLRFLDLKGQKS